MRLTISLDDDLYAFVKARSRAGDQSMSAVISELIRHAKEPGRFEPIRLLEVRNGIPIYSTNSDRPFDAVRAAEEDEAAEDLRQAQIAGVEK